MRTDPGSARALLGHTVGGRYRLDALLGSGSSSMVYRARHLLIEREVALKMLRTDACGREEHRPWFLREARAVNRINHVNIADIFDFGETSEGVPFLVMELLTGERLADLVRRGPVPAAVALDVVVQTASALARAHDLGVVHRDLKPEHIFLERRGGRRWFVKLIDFGLAAIRHEAALAAAGAVLGTPAYLSPEQARGEEAGPAADLYSLGVVLFEMVTGRLPFEPRDPRMLLECHLSVPPPDPRELCPGLDEDLAGIVVRLLAKKPRDRFVDAYHLLDECQSLLRAQPSVHASRSGAETERVPASAEGAPAAAPVAVAALKTSVLARMAAATYPDGRGPRQVMEAVEAMWRLVAELSQAEGELLVLARWEENLRSRAREFAERVGREVENLSRARSLHRREIESAARALTELEQRALATSEALHRLRARIDEVEASGSVDFPRQDLESAGALAARREMTLDAIARVKGKIAHWENLVRQRETQRRRLQRELDRHAAHSEGEIEAARPRVTVLVARRESLAAALATAERLLVQHFERRSECSALLDEYRRVAASPGT